MKEAKAAAVAVTQPAGWGGESSELKKVYLFRKGIRLGTAMDFPVVVSPHEPHRELFDGIVWEVKPRRGDYLPA